MPLATGDRLGAYEVVAAIGRGGMGEVWRARDPRLGRDVAIKVSAQQPKLTQCRSLGTYPSRTPEFTSTRPEFKRVTEHQHTR
jgi:serine/threonine protein kinase